MRFESSAGEAEEMVSLDAYVNRKAEGQDSIYYINGPSRAAVESGPYVEMFRKKGVEILYTLEPIDDFVLNHLGSYRDKKLVSADRADLDLSKAAAVQSEKPEAAPQEEPLAKDAVEPLCAWIKEVLGERVNAVKPSSRLVDSPAMIVNVDGYMTSSMERLLKASGQDGFGVGGKKDMEINAASPLIKNLAALRESDADFAADLAWQMYDNAKIQAGLDVDSMEMVRRNYRILERAAGK